MRWPDVEAAARSYLATVTGRTVWTETPATASGTYLIVERTGGTSEHIHRDVDLEITAIAPTRAGVWQLAGDIEVAMFEAAASSLGNSVYCDDVHEVFGFAADPPDDPRVRKARATYQITVRPI